MNFGLLHHTETAFPDAIEKGLAFLRNNDLNNLENGLMTSTVTGCLPMS